MKKITLLKRILFTVILLLMSFKGFTQNLLNNGNFETGGIVGFNINGAGYSQIGPVFSGNTSPGNYAITTNPQPMNTSSFISCGDHTTGTGNMLIIDGNSTGGQQNFWEAGNGGSGVCGMTIGATYTFSYWIRSVYGTVSGGPTPANIGVQILNANAVTLISGTPTAPLTALGWQQVVYTFVPTGNCVNIKLYNNNTNVAGNDFAVDDFSVTAPPSPLLLSYSFTNPTCPTNSDGSIVVFGSNGVPPYIAYNLTGASTQSNATGVFTGLTAGTYNASVTDSNGNITNQLGIILTDPPGLTVSSNTAICAGSSTTLTVSGSSAGYTWSALPADSSLTTPNSAAAVVSPTQTTTYTVTSTSTTNLNLITNGNFTNGNSGFTSDYTYYTSNNTAYAQKAYGVVSNPNTWESGFSATCVDHTSGTGKMLVVDGSIYNSGNDVVWGQTVAVTPGQNYTFTFFGQSVTNSSPASIKVVINGVTVGTLNLNTTLCGWLQFTPFVWNSGVATSAQIKLIDTNVTAGGNDFAIDDISFKTSTICSLHKDVTITVNPALMPTITCGTSTSSSVTFNWGAVAGATSYDISYSVNNGPILIGGNTLLTTYTVSSLNTNDSVKIFVAPIGTDCFAVGSVTCNASLPCPIPTVSVTQPTCSVPTGSIVFTGPLNPAPLPIPTDLFISEVTDEDVGSLTYVEIYNGTGVTKNLANYRLKVYNNGSGTASCDLLLSGSLSNNSVVVVAVGSAVNQGGVVPNLVFAGCGGVNTDDNIRLTTSANVEIDLWGRTDGVAFTPSNAPGYSYRRLTTALHPSLVWNAADWTALDPQDYSNVGTFIYQTASYQYSVNGGTSYQTSNSFTGLASGNYNAQIKDLVSGCISNPIPIVLNTVTISAAPVVTSPISYCQNAVAVPLTATPSVGGTLNWYGTNATGGVSSATAPTPLTTTLGSITYYVSQTIGGCEGPRAPIVVNIANTAPTAPPQLFCDAATTSSTQVGFDFNSIGQTSFTYTYSIDGGSAVTGTIPFSPSSYIVHGVTQGQTVTITITWNGVCAPSLTTSCTASCTTSPVLSITNPSAVCSPNTVDITAAAITAGSTGAGTLSYWTDATATTALINPAAVATSGTYYIKSALGGCYDIKPVLVAINPSPSLSITSPNAVCSPNSVDITLPAVIVGNIGGGILSYWTNSTATTSLSNPNAVLASGTYYIKSTLGSCFDIKPVTVTINPSPSLVITNPVAVCSPSTVDLTLPALTAGSTGGGILSYWTNATATTTLNNPNVVNASGTYYIKSTLGVCYDIKPVVVTISPSPSLIITNPSAVCSPTLVDITLPSITVGSTGGGILSYWTNAAATTSLANPSAITVGGTYYIKSTLGTCSDIKAVTVTINPSPSLTITSPIAVCSPSNVDITAPAVTAGSTGGGILSYWTNATATSSLTNPSAITVGGTYYIKSTVGTCFDIKPVTVTITATPVLVVSNPSAVCSPASIDITLPTVTAGSTGGGVLTYWTNVAATTSLANPTTVSAGGTYYIKSTVGSCFDIKPINVLINPSPVLLITNPISVCSPSTVDITLASVTSGSSGGVFLTYWNNATASTSLLNPTAISINGTYYIKSTDLISGCAIIKPVTVTINNPVLVITNPIAVCSPATVDITLPVITAGSTGGGILSYWTDAAATIPLVNPSAIALSGTYYIKSTLGTCSDIKPVTVSMISNFNVNTPLPLHKCDPNNDGFETFDLTQTIVGMTGGNPNYTISFHETFTDANVGGTSIIGPSNYTMIVPWNQIIYIRVASNISSCYQVVQLQLIVDPTPEATTPADYVLCDYTGAVGYEAFDLTTRIPEVLGSIDPTLNTVTFYANPIDAQNGVNAITNVTNYVNSSIYSQTIYVRVTTNATGCYDIVELHLVVNPLPVSLQPNYPQYSLCDYTGAVGYETFDLASQVTPILLGQTGMSVTFYPSLASAQLAAPGTSINDTDPSLQYINQTIYVQTLGIVITNNTTGCSVISTMDIRVDPLPTPIPPTTPFTLCDGNQDGFTTFDLTTLIPDLLQGSNYIITFHETLADANANGTTIPTPTSYNNITPFVQILYVRAEDPNTHCFSVIPIELNVNPSPVAPVSISDITVCDTDSNTQDAITAIDLTIRTASILAQEPLAPSNYTVTYYNTQALAIAGTAPIIQATHYIGSNGETIWVRVEDNATGCYNLGSFHLVINIPLALTTPQPLSICDDNHDQYYAFDLTIKDGDITQHLPGYTVTYYVDYPITSSSVAISPATSYTNIHPAVQTLGVEVTSTAGCKSYTTLDIRVLPIPNPHTNPTALAPKCDDNNPGDMVEMFDLTLNAAYIINGDPTLALSYFTTQTDASTNTNPIVDPVHAMVGTNVWIRVENNNVDYQGHKCFVLVEQALTVNPLPTVVQPLAPYRKCDDDADGIAYFDLTDSHLATNILGSSQTPADFTITYYDTLTGANPLTNTGEVALVSPYQNVTPTAQNIYIRVVNNATGCVNTGVLPLAVEQEALATGPQIFSQCDNYNDPYDGIHQINLTQYASAILNGQNPAIFVLSYYHTQAEAEAGINAIPLADAQAYTTLPDTDQIWVKVENTSNSITPVCYALTTIDINVERYPNPILTTINNINTICVDYHSNVVVRPLVLDSNIPNPANYTFEWFEAGAPTTPIAGATGSTYTVDTASPTGATRDYTVHVTSNSPLACDTTSLPFSVIQSGQAAIPLNTTGYTVTNAFSENQIITIMIEGYGTYEYSMDDGPRQSSNVFDNVSLGSHVVHVWDTEGGIAYSCDELIINDVQIIDYPHYFTPNGDGYHDNWNIVGLGGQAAAKIYIFDRYGKLIKQISSQSPGWDGTYNGHPLPSDDYWFTVEYLEQTVSKIFKAHFSMKR